MVNKGNTDLMTFSRCVLAALFLAVIIFVIVDTIDSEEYYNLVSLGGMAFYIAVFFVFSYSPEHVRKK